MRVLLRQSRLISLSHGIIRRSGSAAWRYAARWQSALCLAHLTSHEGGQVWINIEGLEVGMIPTADIQNPGLWPLSNLAVSRRMKKVEARLCVLNFGNTRPPALGMYRCIAKRYIFLYEADQQCRSWLALYHKCAQFRYSTNMASSILMKSTASIAFPNIFRHPFKKRWHSPSIYALLRLHAEKNCICWYLVYFVRLELSGRTDLG